MENTKKTFSHANNLRFNFKKDGRFYEYAVDTINKKIKRQERLIEFLGLFARIDAIRDHQFEFATDSDTETSNSENENE